MGVQGRMNQQGDRAEGQGGPRVTQAMDQKRKAQETADSIRQQVREKIKEHYEGTT